jgi:hypothetical protein
MSNISKLKQKNITGMLKMTAFWDIAPCSLVEVDRSFGAACCGDGRPDDGFKKHLRNVGQLLRDYTAQYSTIFSSSFSPP